MASYFSTYPWCGLALVGSLALAAGCDDGARSYVGFGSAGQSAGGSSVGGGSSGSLIPVGTGGSISIGGSVVGGEYPSASFSGPPAYLAAFDGGTPVDGGTGTCTVYGTPGAAAAPTDAKGPLTVLVVFDKSGSMGDFLDGKSKFDTANAALLNAIQGVEDTLTIGAIRFPIGDVCGVPDITSPAQIPFMSGRDFEAKWIATTPQFPADGNTPMALAIAVADRVIRAAQAAGEPGRRYRVALITDGEPNCGSSQDDLIGFPAYWRMLGIETAIIGLPGSEGASALLASMQSGESCFVQATSAPALSGAVYAIVR